MHLHRHLLGAAALVIIAGCTSASGWSEAERALIGSPDSVMRVLTVQDEADSLLLRQPSAGISAKELADPLYAELARKMVATVTSPEQGGVGIAGPQVGILRRVVAVQRFDKPGEPFEVYPNIRITEMRGEKEPGGEGCLPCPAGAAKSCDIATSTSATRHRPAATRRNA